MGALAGRKVVVTRAAEQADDLADLLIAAGAVPVVVPLIEIVTEAVGAAELAALAPDHFDWLVVTSANGAAAYTAAHGSAPAGIGAVGATTAAVLAAAGLQVTLVPSVQRAAGLVDEFPTGEGRVLLVQAADAEDTMAVGLRAKGWQVTVVAPYRSRPVRPTAGQQLRALSADAVLFASGSSARAWVAVFGDTTPPIVVAIGPRTAAAVTEVGLKVTVIATDHSLRAMVSALERQLAASD